MLKIFNPDLYKLKKEYDEIKKRKPEPDDRDYIQIKIINDRKIMCGMIGYYTNVIGFGSIIIPFLAPLFIIVPVLVDIIFSTKVEAEMIYLLAFHYGYKPHDPILEPLKNYILRGDTPKGEVLDKLETTACQESNKEKMTRGIFSLISVSRLSIIQDFIRAPQKYGKLLVKIIGRIGRRLIIRTMTKIPFIGLIGGFWANQKSAKKTGNLALEWLTKLNERK